MHQPRMLAQTADAGRIVHIQLHQLAEHQHRHFFLKQQRFALGQFREALLRVAKLFGFIKQGIDPGVDVTTVVVAVGGAENIEKSGGVTLVAVPATAPDHEVTGLEVFLEEG